MSNGCGCEKGILRYVPIPYGKRFYAACCQHDDNYDWGGNAFSRRCYDWQLFSDMMKLIYKNELKPMKMWWMTTVALGYYLAVRVFGRFYFNYTRN